MRRAYVVFALVATNCVTPPRRPSPAQLVEVSVDPPAVAHDRVSRMPTVTLVFDRAIEFPGPEAIWVLSGPPSPSIESEALRGALGTTHRSRRIDAEVTLDPTDSTRVRIAPREPLMPDTEFTVVTTVHLVTTERAPVGPAGAAPAPMVFPFRVAPAPQCPPLARLRFPLGEDVPRNVSRVVVGFDRPVRAAGDGVPAVLTTNDGVEVPSVSLLSCGDDRRGFACVEVVPSEVLQPMVRYTVRLGSLFDDGGLAPQPVALQFTTGPEESAPPVYPSAPVSCASDEIERAPFCVRVTATAVEVRGETTSPGALRVRMGDVTAESPAGVRHRVRVEPVPPGQALPIDVWTVAMDGSVTGTYTLEPVTTAPPLPRLRITEVLARPRSSPAQEFVEVVNDGTDPVSTEGLVIATPSGISSLPSVMVPPGARAVIVGARFDPRGDPRGEDPPVAPGTLLVRLETSIASRGLADRGTDVWISDREGHTISRAPAGSGFHPPRPGVSLVRADERMNEDDPASWSYDAAGGSTPGLPDRIR